MTRTNTDLFTKASLLSVLLDGDLTNSTGPSSYASPSNALVAADVRLHIRPGLSCYLCSRKVYLIHCLTFFLLHLERFEKEIN